MPLTSPSLSPLPPSPPAASTSKRKATTPTAIQPIPPKPTRSSARIPIPSAKVLAAAPSANGSGGGVELGLRRGEIGIPGSGSGSGRAGGGSGSVKKVRRKSETSVRSGGGGSASKRTGGATQENAVASSSTIPPAGEEGMGSLRIGEEDFRAALEAAEGLGRLERDGVVALPSPPLRRFPSAVPIPTHTQILPSPLSPLPLFLVPPTHLPLPPPNRPRAPSRSYPPLPPLPGHLRLGDTVTYPGEPDKHGCPYCEKVYKGKHARSVCRRHLVSGHGVGLGDQVKRSRWDNNPNRPATEEEKHQRTLESKRRWAAKDRRRRRAKKLGIPVEELGEEDEDGEDDGGDGGCVEGERGRGFEEEEGEEGDGEEDAEGEPEEEEEEEAEEPPQQQPSRHLRTILPAPGPGRGIQYYQAPLPTYGEEARAGRSQTRDTRGYSAQPPPIPSTSGANYPARTGVYAALGMQIPGQPPQPTWLGPASVGMSKSRSADAGYGYGAAPALGVGGRGRSVPRGLGSGLEERRTRAVEDGPRDEEAAQLLLAMMSSPPGVGVEALVGRQGSPDEETPSKRGRGRVGTRIGGGVNPEPVGTTAGRAQEQTTQQSMELDPADFPADLELHDHPATTQPSASASEDPFAGLDTLASLAQMTTPTRPAFPSFEEVIGPHPFSSPGGTGWARELGLLPNGLAVGGLVEGVEWEDKDVVRETPRIKRGREGEGEGEADAEAETEDRGDGEGTKRVRVQ